MKFNEYSIFLFWKIGKKVYEKKNFCENSVQKLSDYYSYYFGDSLLFTRENIHFMKRLYLNFPIFFKRMEELSWKQYQLLLLIPNREERFFYFYLVLLFHSNYEEMCSFINNNYYMRI